MAEARDNYKKTDLKLELINELRSRSMTRNDIKNFLSNQRKMLGKVPVTCRNPEKYKVSDKTVKRVIDSIDELYGDQLDFNPEFKTYKLDLHDFPDTINETEIQALDVALQKMKNNTNARKSLENLKAKLSTRLYRKIKHTEPTSAIRKIYDAEQNINSNYAIVGPQLIVKFDESVKTLLDSAISKRHEVQFKYYNKDVTVQPVGIIHSSNNVYLIAYEKNAKKDIDRPRHYILSAISHLIDTKQWFPDDRHFSLQEYANSMFGVYNDGKIYDIEWLIKDTKTIAVAKQYLFHPTQQFIENPDGSLTVKMHTGGLHAISSFLTTWNGQIIPIAPKELIDEYKKLLLNCLDSIKK